MKVPYILNHVWVGVHRIFATLPWVKSICNRAAPLKYHWRPVVVRRDHTLTVVWRCDRRTEFCRRATRGQARWRGRRHLLGARQLLPSNWRALTSREPRAWSQPPGHHKIIHKEMWTDVPANITPHNTENTGRTTTSEETVNGAQYSVTLEYAVAYPPPPRRTSSRWSSSLAGLGSLEAEFKDRTHVPIIRGQRAVASGEEPKPKGKLKGKTPRGDATKLGTLLPSSPPKLLTTREDMRATEDS